VAQPIIAAGTDRPFAITLLPAIGFVLALATVHRSRALP